MSKDLSAFQPVGPFDGIYVAHKGNLRCTAIRLASGGLCLYSPVQGLGPIARDSLDSIGEVTHLLAPNHYHNKGLREFRSLFPAAALCCTAAAMPRLVKQTDLSFVDLNAADVCLSEGATFIEPQGLKSGEVWLRMVTADDVLWVVTDAFCGTKDGGSEFSQKPELLGTFPKFGIKDRSVYLNWLSAEVETQRPTTLIPCHGALVAGDDIGDVAIGLVENV